MRVCSSCFGDPDIRHWIRDQDGPRGCDFCGKFDSPTVDLRSVCRRIEECLHKFWGLAVEQLPYESAEGGYQGRTWSTYEILFFEEGLSLPRDEGTLSEAIVGELADELWCDWDWLSLDDDVALRLSWETFCENVKHKRRFFFHALGGSVDDRDSYSAERLLNAIGRCIQELDLIKELPAGTRMWRARADIPAGKRVRPSDFGPPPKEFARQSNRMNPAGIPMMYTASSARTAKLETRAASARVGQWKTLRPARILDFRSLPEVPGTFSDATRRQTLELRFLHHFMHAIMSPVERDERVHIDYLPSQVVTEFLRDFPFLGGKLDGIAYGSTVHSKGWNIALFAEPPNLGLQGDEWDESEQWIEFQKAIRI